MLTRHLEDGRHFASRGMARLVAQARAGYPEFAAIAILDPSGRVVASDPPTTEEGRTTAGIDLSDREWLGEILRGHRTVTHPDVEASAIRQSRPGLPIGAPISDGRGGLRGVVVAWLRLDAIQALTDRIRFGRTGFAQMTTALGVLLAHERPVHVLERGSLSELSVWPIVKSQASGQLPLYTGLSGDRRLAGFATVPEVGWKIWVIQSRAEIEGDLIATYRRLLGWTLVALLATLALAILVASQVSSPIAALRKTASAIASGAATLSTPVAQGELLDVILTATSAPAAGGHSPDLVTRHVLRERRGRLRTLLAEDHPVNQKLAVRLLGAAGPFRRGGRDRARGAGRPRVRALRSRADGPPDARYGRPRSGESDPVP